MIFSRGARLTINADDRLNMRAVGRAKQNSPRAVSFRQGLRHAACDSADRVLAVSLLCSPRRPLSFRRPQGQLCRARDPSGDRFCAGHRADSGRDGQLGHYAGRPATPSYRRRCGRIHLAPRPARSRDRPARQRAPGTLDLRRGDARRELARGPPIAHSPGIARNVDGPRRLLVRRDCPMANSARRKIPGGGGC